MTREEAIEKLEAFAPMVVDDTREALELAIEALSTDAVMRDATAEERAGVQRYIDSISTETVQVVRCKDCDSYVEVAWWFDDEGKKKECHCCVAHSIPVQPNDYCSYGERKEK